MLHTFFLYDLALGDVVVTSAKADRKYVVKTVAEPSGCYVFRVWFGESFQPRGEIADELKALGSLVEWSSRNLLAVEQSTGSTLSWWRTSSLSLSGSGISSMRPAVPDQLTPPARVLRRFFATRASSMCSSEARSSPDSSPRALRRSPRLCSAVWRAGGGYRRPGGGRWRR